MIIAREKKKSNIAEYVLYMWQVEDIIRAHNFDLDKINEHIIKGFDQPASVLAEISDWYTNLIIMMKEEGITESGHLSMVNNVLRDMEDFHHRLLESNTETKYKEVYSWAKPNIEELRERIKSVKKGDIEVSLTGLYGLLLMRLKKREVTQETVSAMTTLSNLMALFSAKYKQFEEGKLELE